MFILCGRVLKWLLLTLCAPTLVLAQTIAVPPPIKLAMIETLQP